MDRLGEKMALSGVEPYKKDGSQLEAVFGVVS